jgi:hypothetical protein
MRNVCSTGKLKSMEANSMSSSASKCEAVNRGKINFNGGHFYMESQPKTTTLTTLLSKNNES